MDKKDPIEAINQICEVKNCNKAIYILNRRRKDSYMWLSNTPRGPSALFLIENSKSYLVEKNNNIEINLILFQNKLTHWKN